MLKQAFEVKKNVYFNYEFNPLEVDSSFPDVIQKSLAGLLYKHEIEFGETLYCLYFGEELNGPELDKLKADWLSYCPID